METYVNQTLSLYNRVNDQVSRIDEHTFFYLLFLNHAFVTANNVFRNMKMLLNDKSITQIPLLAGFLFMIAAGLGGSICNSVITAKPMVFLEMDVIILFFFVAWVLVAFFPGQLIHYITGNPLVELLTYSIEGVFIGTFMINAVNNGVNLFPTRIFAPIIMGTLSVVGGLILKPIFLNMYLGKQYESTIVGLPNFDLFVPVGISSFYFGAKYMYNMKTELYNVAPKTAVELGPEIIVKIAFVVYLLWLWFSNRVAGIGYSRRVVPVQVVAVAPKAPVIVAPKNVVVTKANKDTKKSK
ncbi:hypothetical protein AKO1_008134 [Acrasis kona]|uniref:Uncharacterized protein n=1 Tax=Acrasis kona TaxID=1008807 RepID=A0AAW2YND2_9EUKA